MAGTLLAAARPALAAVPAVETGKYYDVEYENSNGQFRTIKRVKVVDLVTIGHSEFLVIESSSPTNPVRGFVRMELVKSILPEGGF